LFNIGFAELILVLLIAFLVVGPKDLPKVARWLGRLVKKIRQMIREVKEELGWDELENDTRDMRRDIDQTVKEADVTKDLREASRDFQKSVNEAKKAAQKKD